MSPSNETIFVTGANGRLGQCVIRSLGKHGAHVIAGVRDASKARAFSLGQVEVRVADYDHQITLESAFAGVDRLLLISSSDHRSRVEQHRAVIAAARHAGVGLIAYTSVLHADRSPLTVAADHRATEADLAASGIPFIALRNGWYTENYTQLARLAFHSGALLGCAGQGRISSATRADYADAAAAVLTRADRSSRVYELAGDESYTLADLAALISELAGRSIPYRDLPEAGYRAALIEAGMVESIAGLVAASDTAAAAGALFDEDRALSTLIGRPTTPLRVPLAAALAPTTA